MDGAPVSFAEVKLGTIQAKSIQPGVALPHRLDLGAAQQSAIGMRALRIDPNAQVEILNCHPQMPTWRFSISNERPTLAVQIPGERAIGVEAKIRTVLIEPELDRVCVVWVGEHHVPVPIGPGKRAQIKFAAQWAR